MKARYHITCILLCLLLLVGCTFEGVALGTSTGNGEGEVPQTEVALHLAIPTNELPSTRSISDDSAIEKITIWAFKDNEFAYRVSDKDVAFKNNKLYVLLPEGEEVTLAVIANAATVPEISKGTSKVVALGSLTYSIGTGQPDRMPMYGECTLSHVAAGSKGTLFLKRAMAKIVVDASAVKGLLQLEQVKLIQVNQDGYIASGFAPDRVANLEFNVAADNQLTVYIPGIQHTFAANRRVSVLLKGKYSGTDSFYRLDFLSNGKEVESIERNHAYIFKIENVRSSGYSSEGAALDLTHDASNKLGGTAEADLVIVDESIMDITTDGQYYLGVTSAKITAGQNENGYFANFSIVSNNVADGWEIKELPEGITASVLKGAGDGNATSVWIYIVDKSVLLSREALNVFVYSGGIRKKIEIIIKD